MLKSALKISLVLAAGKKLRKAAAMGKPYRYYAPTTLTQLAALVPPDLEARIRLYDQGVEKLPDQWDANIVAISAMTCAAPEAYRISEKARNQGAKVVMGGPHVSFQPQEALKVADTVVIGYAEQSWPRLLMDFKQGKLQQVYRECPLPEDSPLLSPDRSLLNSKRYLIVNTLEATRGCPNSCRYCAINQMGNNLLTQRPLKSVIQEIEQLGKYLLFLDPNPMGHRDYMINLLKELIPFKVKWFCGATLKLTKDPELLDLAVKSGLKGVLIGFESVNQESLQSMDKSFNQVQDYIETIGILRDSGITVLGCFVFGFDQDDKGVFERTVEFVDKARIDLVKYGILTPLPGSPIFRQWQDQGRIITQDWELYDSEHCLFRPAQLTPEHLEEGCIWAYRQTYSISSILRRTVKKDCLIHYTLPANLGFKQFFTRSKENGEEV